MSARTWIARARARAGINFGRVRVLEFEGTGCLMELLERESSSLFLMNELVTRQDTYMLHSALAGCGRPSLSAR